MGKTNKQHDDRGHSLFGKSDVTGEQMKRNTSC